MPYYDIMCDGCGDVLTDFIMIDELNDYLETEVHTCGGSFSIRFNNFTTNSDLKKMESEIQMLNTRKRLQIT